MRAWLETLAPRERALVLGGGAIALLILLYLLAVEPALEAREQRRERLAQLERELAWMRGAAAELQQLGGAAAAATGDRPPYLAVDRALREAGLPRPRSLEPVGADGARVELEAVAFDVLMRVLERLRARDGLQVTRARFTRLGPGQVEAGLTLERGE